MTFKRANRKKNYYLVTIMTKGFFAPKTKYFVINLNKASYSLIIRKCSAWPWGFSLKHLKNSHKNIFQADLVLIFYNENLKKNHLRNRWYMNVILWVYARIYSGKKNLVSLVMFPVHPVWPQVESLLRLCIVPDVVYTGKYKSLLFPCLEVIADYTFCFVSCNLIHMNTLACLIFFFTVA